MIFENKFQLENYISKRNYPKDLQDELLQSMEQVRECINGGADNSAVAIAETIEEEQEIRTKYRLAADAGVSPSYISALERGEKCPTVETLDSICFALQITLVDFLSKKDNYFDKLSALSPRQKTLLNDFLESL